MFPVIVEDVIPHWLFGSLQDDLKCMELLKRSNEGDPIFWGMSPTEAAGRNTLLMSMTYAKCCVQRLVPYHLIYAHTMINGSTANQPGGRFHVDVQPAYYGPDPSYMTAILYTSPEWDTQWGGETVIKTPDGSYSYSTYIPNNLVIFPSTWEHYGASPNDSCPILRTSLGFGFEVCYNRPIER